MRNVGEDVGEDLGGYSISIELYPYPSRFTQHKVISTILDNGQYSEDCTEATFLLLRHGENFNEENIQRVDYKGLMDSVRKIVLEYESRIV